jgi:hypothetical protein
MPEPTPLAKAFARTAITSTAGEGQTTWQAAKKFQQQETLQSDLIAQNSEYCTTTTLSNT